MPGSRGHAESVHPTTVISTDPELLAAESGPGRISCSAAPRSNRQGGLQSVPLTSNHRAGLAPLACEHVHADMTPASASPRPGGVFTRYERKSSTLTSAW